MAGSKGPAIMLIKGQSQYRQAYIMAVGVKNWYAAVDALTGMASILPKEAKFAVSEPPDEIFKQVIDKPEELKIKQWLLREKNRVEQAVSGYVYKFYKTGAVSL